MLPSQILEHALAANRKMGWVPYMRPRHYTDTSGGRDTRGCFLVAMCRVLRGIDDQGFALPEACEARAALREVLGVDDFGAWNDTRHAFREVEDGVMRTVRVLRARGR